LLLGIYKRKRKWKNYEKQAENFAKKHGLKMSFIGEPIYKKYFLNDRQQRWVFKIKLTRNKKSFTFTFGQSISKGIEAPSIYDVLATSEKYDVGSFEDFINEFGYEHSNETKKLYKAVIKNYNQILKLFPESEILEELQEIN
jgi:hypothetical protein